MNDLPDLQATLQSAYSAQADCYARALPLAAELAGACRRGEAVGEEGVRPLLALLDEAAVREAALAEVQRRWREAGRPADAPLRATLEHVAALATELGRTLQLLEEAVRARRDRLAAELDDGNRRRQMQRAYLRKT